MFPFLPADFDERYYQAAPTDQQLPIPLGEQTVTHLAKWMCLGVAGKFGSAQYKSMLEIPGVGEVSAAAVRAIEDEDMQRGPAIALAKAALEGHPGLLSAFASVSAEHLQGTTPPRCVPGHCALPANQANALASVRPSLPSATRTKAAAFTPPAQPCYWAIGHRR